ncbi:MAG: hypothetical protein RLN69_16525 [Woeseiaceae bacterium]
MKAGDLDWGYVLQGTLVPCLTALVAALLLATSVWYQHAQEKLFDDFSNDHGAVFDDYNQLVMRKRIVDRYLRRYEQFHSMGFVGRERRLDWVETLKAAAGDLRLPHATYAIEPQLDVIAPIPGTGSGTAIEIHVSRVELDVGLLHEVDLLHFFDRLQSEAPGLVSVDSCKLTRQVETSAMTGIDANIQANCSVEIFSVVTSDVMAQERGR